MLGAVVLVFRARRWNSDKAKYKPGVQLPVLPNQQVCRVSSVGERFTCNEDVGVSITSRGSKFFCYGAYRLMVKSGDCESLN